MNILALNVLANSYLMFLFTSIGDLSWNIQQSWATALRRTCQTHTFSFASVHCLFYFRQHIFNRAHDGHYKTDFSLQQNISVLAWVYICDYLLIYKPQNSDEHQSSNPVFYSQHQLLSFFQNMLIVSRAKICDLIYLT